MTRHDDRERRLNEYIDGTLSEDDRDRVVERIAQDEAWAEEYEHLKALRDSAGALPRQIAPPRDLWPEIEAKIHRTPAPEPRRRFWSFVPQWAPAGIALAAAVFLAVVMRPAGNPIQDARGGDPRMATRAAVFPAIVHALDYECLGAGKHLVASIHELRSPVGGVATASIQADLEILESAIGETKAALEQNPENTRILRILTDLYEQKLSLLHRAMQLTRVA